MRAVVQRVTSARVTVDDDVVSEIDRGIVALIGIMPEDTQVDVESVVRKISEMRIFGDEHGRMNLSLEDIEGSVLVVSQFTLCADIAKGRRPSFTRAADPEVAHPLVEAAVAGFRERGIGVGAGVFGARMVVDLSNDGPVTFVIDTVDGYVI